MMKSLQMKNDLTEMLRKVVDHFQISSETYYHSILLFNLVRLKKGEEDRREFYEIPVRLRKNRISESGFKEQDVKDMSQSQIEHIRVPRSEMPDRNKLYLAACFFLAHKLYEPYPLCLFYLMKQLGIQSQFQEYIVSLQIQFLCLLNFKIENMLPSDQTLIACQKWDLFLENISHSCVDVKFGIRKLFQNLKKQISTLKSVQLKSEFKNFQNQQNIEALIKNIEILVHNQGLYELYLKKSQNHNSLDLHPMQKIGLAITYLTILQQSSMIFVKQVGVVKKNNEAFQIKDTGFLDFVFDDFLKSEYDITLKKLHDEISVTRIILQKISKRQSKCSQKCKINSVRFLLKGQKKLVLGQQNRNFHIKCKQDKSTSSTKIKKQNGRLKNQSKKGKNRSIVNFSVGKDEILESTVHQSMASQKANTYLSSLTSLKKENEINKNLLQQKKKFTKKSEQFYSDSMETKLTRTDATKKSSTNKKKFINFTTNQLQYRQEYSITHFTPFDD